MGVAAARRLVAKGASSKLLRDYVKTAPKTMPFSDDDPDTTPRKRLRIPQKPRVRGPKVFYREISGGAPTLGKKRR